MPAAMWSVASSQTLARRFCSPAGPSATGQVMSIVWARKTSVETSRSVSSSWLRRIGWSITSWWACSGVSVEQVALGADAGAQRHDDRLADRVDRRVGDLREQLLEVAEQRRALIGEHRQRRVVAHRADRLLGRARHRRVQHAQVLLRVAEGELALPQRQLLVDAVGQSACGRSLKCTTCSSNHEVYGRCVEIVRLTSASSTIRPCSRSTRKILPGCRRPRRLTFSGRIAEHPRLRAEHDVAVLRLDPAAGAQAVAVERGADDAAVGEGDGRGPVPRLHQARVEGVEALELVGEVVAVLVGLRDHHHHRVRQRAPGEHQQLEDVVERRRVRAAGAHDRHHLLQVDAEQLGRQLRLARAHPVDVAHQRVDLAVVADHAVGMGELPARERVGREAAVHERQRAGEALVAAGRDRSRRAGAP